MQLHVGHEEEDSIPGLHGCSDEVHVAADSYSIAGTHSTRSSYTDTLRPTP